MILLVMLTKMIACSGILYGYYWLFLRNQRFHHYNRFYLLGATALSLTFPLLKIPVFLNAGTSTGGIVYRSIDVISVNRWEDDVVETGSTGTMASWLSIENLSILFYSLVTFGLLVVLVRSLIYILRLAKKYPFQYLEDWKFFNTSEPGTPFSFFRLIFWNNNIDLSSKEGQQILRHEIYHVKQQHSADIIFMELITIFLWINPFFHLMKKELRAIHEFLADRHAVSNHNEHDYAELLILQSLRIKRSPISNYFFQTHIKRRIAMITQFKRSRYGYLTRMLALPLSILLFCAIALYAKPRGNGGAKISPATSEANKVSRPLTILVDAGHGGKDDGATNQQGLVEKDLALSIAQKIKENGSNFNIEVVMTRNDDVAPSLKERAELAKSVNAAMIISIHVASSEQPATDQGFDIFVTNKNQKTMNQSRQLGQNISNQIQMLYKVSPVKQRKEKGIYILDAVDCPAVLIECGYLSNEKDVAFVTNADNQSKIAKAILQGIVSYKEAGVSYSVADTVPKAKKSRESAIAVTEKNIPIEDSIQEVQKKAVAELRRLEQKQAELQERQEVLNSKQQENAIAQQKLVERNLTLHANQEQMLAKKQQDLKEKHELLQERRKIEMNRHEEIRNEKQKQIQLRQDEKRIDNQKQEELQLKLQKQSSIDVKKQEELELSNLKNLELRMEALEKKQQIQFEKQKQVEIEHKKRIELQMKELDEKKIKQENEKRLKEEPKDNSK